MKAGPCLEVADVSSTAGSLSRFRLTRRVFGSSHPLDHWWPRSPGAGPEEFGQATGTGLYPCRFLSSATLGCSRQPGVKED